MGQNVSGDSNDFKHFRKMLKHTYHGKCDRLMVHFNNKFINYQISRASFLAYSRYQLGEIEKVVDSMERVKLEDKHTTEKIEFFSAVDTGQIGLGDTLLHIAVRFSYYDIVDFLIDQNARENIPNFQGLKALDCWQHLNMRLVMQDVATVHQVIGTQEPEKARVHGLIRSIRRIWPLWMFSPKETGNLVRVLFDIRSAHPLFSKLLKILGIIVERYEYTFTVEGLLFAKNLLIESDGKLYLAIETFQSWSQQDKLNFLYQIFSTLFPRWKPKQDSELEQDYEYFLEKAVESWVTIVHDLRLHRQLEAPMPTLEDMKKYHASLWERRLHPPSEALDVLCTHIDALQQHFKMKNLRV